MGYLHPIRASSDIQLIFCIPSFWQLMTITPETCGQNTMVIRLGPYPMSPKDYVRSIKMGLDLSD